MSRWSATLTGDMAQTCVLRHPQCVLRHLAIGAHHRRGIRGFKTGGARRGEHPIHVEVDPAQPAVDVMYLTIVPGDPIAPGAQHVGSVPDAEHGVVHVFEVPLG